MALNEMNGIWWSLSRYAKFTKYSAPAHDNKIEYIILLLIRVASELLQSPQVLVIKAN